jgi:hypothetical protein
LQESEDLDEYYKRKVHEFPSHPLILNKYAEYLQVSCFIFSNDFVFFFQLDVLKPVTWDFEVWNEGCVLSFIIESLEKFIFVDLDSDFWV